MHKKSKDKLPDWIPLFNKESKKCISDLSGVNVNVLGEIKSDKAIQRKQTPIYSGVLAYFPRALGEVSRASLAGNKQHLDGQPLHWDRTKSTDQLDAATRHIIDHAKGEPIDDDGVYHLGKTAWRVLAELELILEKNESSDQTR